MATEPQSFTILLVPEHLADGGGTAPEEAAVRSAVVEATGEMGETGYPRYAGQGIVAEIDPRTRVVEGVLVDGSELDYGMAAMVAS
ncbi:hypothetical protein ACIRQH_10880 [Streptomyces sp. NPDC102279]|uniref:hypothetical protein n=1 Tax=Streptomyces sp. NPDC102279 TaxID=3366153 RepID=UPI00382EDAA5